MPTRISRICAEKRNASGKTDRMVAPITGPAIFHDSAQYRRDHGIEAAQESEIARRNEHIEMSRQPATKPGNGA